MGGRLRLSDEEFWTDPTRTRGEVLAELTAADFRGLALDGPRVVPLDRRRSCPMALLWVRDGATDASLALRDAALVVAHDLDGHGVRVARAFVDTSPTGPSPRPTAPAAQRARTLMAMGTGFDLFSVTELGSVPGRHLVTVVARDFMSDLVTVELRRGGEDAYEDPAVKEFLERRRREVVPPPPRVWPPVRPGRELPSYRRDERSPPVPATPGIALAVDRVVVLGTSCVLRGSFRLPVARNEVVRVDPRTGRPHDVGVAEATAVVPIHLVTTGSDLADPFVIRLDVPVTDPVDPAAEAAVVTGHFALDLFATKGAPRSDQTHFIYAVGGGTIQGPTPVAFVAPERLPYAGAPRG